MKRKGCSARKGGVGGGIMRARTGHEQLRKLSTGSSRSVGFCETGRKAYPRKIRPTFSFVGVFVVLVAVVVVVVVVALVAIFVVGGLRENSALLQLTIAIKILPTWAPPTSRGH